MKAAVKAFYPLELLKLCRRKDLTSALDSCALLKQQLCFIELTLRCGITATYELRICQR